MEIISSEISILGSIADDTPQNCCAEVDKEGLGREEHERCLMNGRGKRRKRMKGVERWGDIGRSRTLAEGGKH